MILQSMLPPGVVAREIRSDIDAPLHPREAVQIAKAVPKRQAEYATVRHLARTALAELGIADAVLIKGDTGAVQWPRAVVGALTHCDGFRGAVVGYRMGVRTIGIDAEPHLPLPENVLPSVSVESERRMIERRGGDGLHWDRLLFSAKESTYKAWNPITERWLGFEDAEITFEQTEATQTGAAGTFHSRILIDGKTVDGGGPVAGFDGQWRIVDGLIVTSIAVV